MHIPIALFVFVTVSINNCYSWSIPPTELNEPHTRQIRQVFGSAVPNKDGGFRGTLGGSTTFLNDNGHRLDGHGQISRNFKPNGPTEIGAGLNYHGPRVDASLDANHARHMGTDLNAQGNVNVWKSHNGRTQLDGTANYKQHFGGQGGHTTPYYGAGLRFIHRF